MTTNQEVIAAATQQNVVTSATIEPVDAALPEEDIVAISACEDVITVVGTRDIKFGVVLGDVLMHVLGSDGADIHITLLRDVLLQPLITLADNAVEGNQVTEDDVVAIATVDAIRARNGGLGMSENCRRQFGRVDIGLWFTGAVILLEIVPADIVVKPDSLNFSQARKQLEAGRRTVTRAIPTARVAGTRPRRNLVGAIPLSMDRPQGSVRVVDVNITAGGNSKSLTVDHLVEIVTDLKVVYVHNIIQIRAAPQPRISILLVLPEGRLTIGDEIRQVLRPSVTGGHGALEEVGRCLEHIFIVGTATIVLTAQHRIEHRLQLAEGIRIGKVDRDVLVNLTVEVSQEDVHRTRGIRSQAGFE
ncbi:hypothetical protein D3C80_870890 [compost metagenome]